MAGALSYIHVVVPINISGLLQSVNNFRAKVAGLKANYGDHKKFANRLDYFGGWSATNHTKHALVHFRQQLSGLMDLMISDADNLQTGILSLRNSLPQITETPPGPIQVQDFREKRNAALTILSVTARQRCAIKLLLNISLRLSTKAPRIGSSLFVFAGNDSKY